LVVCRLGNEKIRTLNTKDTTLNIDDNIPMICTICPLLMECLTNSVVSLSFCLPFSMDISSKLLENGQMYMCVGGAATKRWILKCMHQEKEFARAIYS
jgi:hypothetical protein